MPPRSVAQPTSSSVWSGRSPAWRRKSIWNSRFIFQRFIGPASTCLRSAGLRSADRSRPFTAVPMRRVVRARSPATPGIVRQALGGVKPERRYDGGVDRHQFVFVCGLQRSGTTMLYRYLAEHPAVSALTGGVRATNEGQHNQTVYPADDDHSKGGRFAFNPQARMLEDSPLVSDENRAKLFAEWSRLWDTSKPVLLEKSPPNLIRMRFLQAMFPASSFVVIL